MTLFQIYEAMADVIAQLFDRRLGVARAIQ
jgi:hypothetical protein